MLFQSTLFRLLQREAKKDKQFWVSASFADTHTHTPIWNFSVCEGVRSFALATNWIGQVSISNNHTDKNWPLRRCNFKRDGQEEDRSGGWVCLLPGRAGSSLCEDLQEEGQGFLLAAYNAIGFAASPRTPRKVGIAYNLSIPEEETTRSWVISCAFPHSA